MTAFEYMWRKEVHHIAVEGGPGFARPPFHDALWFIAVILPKTISSDCVSIRIFDEGRTFHCFSVQYRSHDSSFLKASWCLQVKRFTPISLLDCGSGPIEACFCVQQTAWPDIWLIYFGPLHIFGHSTRWDLWDIKWESWSPSKTWQDIKAKRWRIWKSCQWLGLQKLIGKLKAAMSLTEHKWSGWAIEADGCLQW